MSINLIGIWVAINFDMTTYLGIVPVRLAIKYSV